MMCGGRRMGSLGCRCRWPGGVFSKRENHRLVVHRVPLPFVFEEAEIVVSRPAVRTVAVTPVTLLTLRATGGGRGAAVCDGGG